MTNDAMELTAIYVSLAPDAQVVLMRIARRMEAGQRQYGNLRIDRDVRDWLEERQQEVADELVYGEIYLAQQKAEVQP